MITLIPSWAHHYDEFWNAISTRNLWFIKLRYGTAGVLIILLLSIESLLGFKLGHEQETAIIFITAAILLYNIVLHWMRRFVIPAHDKFNPLHFSLIQMLLDLVSLSLLAHFTGSIESPLLMLFMFHMIIGSLILPGIVIYSIAILIIGFVSLMVYMEYNGVISHHAIAGFLQQPLYLNYHYITAMLGVFAFVIIVSVLLANRIAKQLYKNEQELVESLDKLRAAEIEKQKYIIGVVHEIKTPLSALHSYLDLILQKFLGPVNEKIEDKLQRAKQRSTEAIQMINSILKISRLRLLNEIAQEPLEVGNVICPLIANQKINFQNKNITLNFFDRREEKKDIYGDDFLLELAFSNLIGNGLKYTPSDGIMNIEISETPGSVKISFCDNGIGIPPEDIDKIFMDFYRASNIRKSYEGTGLGLSIVKNVVESHGGTVTVQSPSPIGTPEHPGACFIVTLPLA